MPLARGARIGAYEVLDSLGAGGMGEVYRARDSKLARSVAIKVLNLRGAANAGAVRRFELEARAASALNHPGIVTIHDTGQSDGQFYIVMELVDGVTLRHLLRRGAPSLKKALDIASQLAVALAKAHDASVVHRDLKPENVMVTREGHVKVVDFGLAKLSEPVLSTDSDRSATESAQGVLLGTVGYMSPEQVRGETADCRADQFAFGAILYELATGARAFHRPTAVETLAMILNEEPPPPSSVKPAIPLPVVWTIERCLAKDPADRYAATRDLARETHTLSDHVGALIALDKPLRAPGRRASLLTFVALSIAVGGAAYLAIHRTTARPAAEAPVFTQLTFGRGHVANARFAPDGRTILYAAGWGGAPIQVFETRPTGPESRALGPASASLASISSTGELALILGCRLDWANCVGTLARMPPGGGAPREILEDVVSADWAPGRQALAAIQVAAGEYRLHFPPGTTLYNTASKLGFVRFSPQGDRLAFVEYQVLSDEAGMLKVINLQGQTTTVSSAFEEIRDVAWSPAGDEIWVSASKRGRTASIYAISLSGVPRLILQTPSAVFLHDVAADRRALVTHGLSRAHMVWSSGTEQRQLSWLDWSTVADLSEDGKTILFYEWGQAVNARPVVYLAFTARLPYISSKFTGEQNEPMTAFLRQRYEEFRLSHPNAAVTSLDTGEPYTTFQDLGFTLRYNLMERGLVVTPFVGATIPSHDYRTVGEAAPGQNLRALHLGVNVGALLYPIVPRAYLHARYTYSFVESLAGIPLDRSSAEFEVGFSVTPTVSVRALGDWMHTHGGVPFSETLKDVALFLVHDRLLASRYWHVGGGATVSLTDSIDVDGAVVTFVSGSDTHYGLGATIGLTWHFHTGSAAPTLPDLRLRRP